MNEPSLTREHRLADAFVTLADSLVKGFDVVDLFHELAASCVDLLEISAAGIMLRDAGGHLRVMSSSSERSRLLELMEIQNEDGPCLDCHREGEPIVVGDLLAERARWPRFGDEALRVGFRAVYALPMRLRADTIGALNLFHEVAGGVSDESLRLAQALADVATIAILQQRAIQSSAEVSQQLQAALSSRVVIEQAKGLLAGRLDIDVAAAFELLRGHARSTSQRLSVLAEGVVTGTVQVEDLRASP
jgi:GAF domain-containing protein